MKVAIETTIAISQGLWLPAAERGRSGVGTVQRTRTLGTTDIPGARR
jgi:hypothetical protein